MRSMCIAWCLGGIAYISALLGIMAVELLGGCCSVVCLVFGMKKNYHAPYDATLNAAYHSAESKVLH